MAGLTPATPVPAEEPMDIPMKTGVQTHIPGVAGKLIDSMINIKTNRQNAAISEMNQQLTAAQHGFPVNPDAVASLAKKGGLHLSTKLPDLVATKQTMQGKGAAAEIDKTGPQGGGENVSMGSLGPGGENASTNPKDKDQGSRKPDDPYAKAYNIKDIADVKEREKAQTNLAVDGIIRQAVTNHQLRGANTQQALEFTHQLMGLKQDALNGDPRAYGTLLKFGAIDFNVDAVRWNAMSPTQQYQSLEVGRGAMTDAQKAAANSNSVSILMAHGVFKNSNDAFQAAQYLSDGKSLPPELASRMRPTTMHDMISQADWMEKMSPIFAKGSDLAHAAQSVSLIGVDNFFPPGFKSGSEELMNLKQEQLKIEKINAQSTAYNAQTNRWEVAGYTDPKTGVQVPGRLATQADMVNFRKQQETDRADLENKKFEQKVDIENATAEQKASRDSYLQLLQLSKSDPGKVSPAVLRAAQIDMAKKFGVSLKEAQSFTYRMTRGMFGSIELEQDTTVDLTKPDTKREKVTVQGTFEPKDDTSSKSKTRVSTVESTLGPSNVAPQTDDQLVTDAAGGK